MKNIKNLRVCKSNALVEASYKLTLNEQRLLLACIAQLDSRKPGPKDFIRITAEEYSETFNVNKKIAYEQLRDASKRLYERDIKTYDGRVRERFRWVYHVKYYDGEGRVDLGISPSIKPYLTLLHKQFTQYEVKQIASLRSVYSIRLFEMLMRFKTTGKAIIDIDDFKIQLEIADKYKRFSNLKSRVINPAVKELKVKSNLIIDWSTMKENRRPTTLIFEFKEDEQLKLAL